MKRMVSDAEHRLRGKLASLDGRGVEHAVGDRGGDLVVGSSP